MEGYGRGRAPSVRPWWGPPRLGRGSRELEGRTSRGRISRPCGNRTRAGRSRRHRRHKNGTPMTTSPSPRPPLPPFDRDAAIQKVGLAGEAWNTRGPARVATGYTPDSVCHNRAEFLSGQKAHATHRSKTLKSGYAASNRCTKRTSDAGPEDVP